MSVLFFWRRDNYFIDMRSGRPYHLNQNNKLTLNLAAGEHIWALTRPDDTYVLAADLVVIQTHVNPSTYKYGRYRTLVGRDRSRYFDVHRGPDAEPLIRSLSFSPQARILGHSFRGKNTVRLLTSADEQKLISFSSGLPKI